jgi:hypothetical protein
MCVTVALGSTSLKSTRPPRTASAPYVSGPFTLAGHYTLTAWILPRHGLLDLLFSPLRPPPRAIAEQICTSSYTDTINEVECKTYSPECGEDQWEISAVTRSSDRVCEGESQLRHTTFAI